MRVDLSSKLILRQPSFKPGRSYCFSEVMMNARHTSMVGGVYTLTLQTDVYNFGSFEFVPCAIGTLNLNLIVSNCRIP